MSAIFHYKNRSEYRSKNRKAGFTLIEILVVMVIIGILVSLGTSTYLSSQVKSRDARRKSDLDKVRGALEMYYNDKGCYPLSDTGKMKDAVDPEDTVVFDWGDKFYDPTQASSNVTIYMPELPSDPSGGRKYYYEADESGCPDSYRLYARLENLQDSSVEGSYAGTDCSIEAEALLCNYALSSPNLAQPTAAP